MHPFKYSSGEAIEKGDNVFFHGNPAVIEFVARQPGDSETTGYIEEHGGGVMVLDPTVSGRTFIPAGQLDDYEDLQFVSRSESAKR